MIAKPIVAILVASIVAASGAAGSFYFASAQEQAAVARPVGLDSYVVSGTADLLLNDDVYSNDERIEVMVREGEELTPTNVEIEFQGDQSYSAANRLETLYGAVTSGF